MDKIEKLQQAGGLYSAISQIEVDLARKMGLLWKLYLLQKLICLKGYSLRQKIKIVFSGTDVNKKFIEGLRSKRYEILKKYYDDEIKKFSLFFTLDNKNYFEKLRCFFSAANEIFYSDCYRTSSLILDTDYVIDCGGNIGLFSIYVKELLPHAHINIFEPESYNFKILKRNLSQYSHINLFNKAVGEKTETRKLKVSKNVLDHTIDNSPDFDLDPGYIGMEEVEIVPIDLVIKSRIDVIKMDIEGYEYKALLGAKDTITKYLPLLLIAIEHSKNQRSNIISLMKSIYSRYKFIALNNNVICFYIPEKHQERVNGL